MPNQPLHEALPASFFSVSANEIEDEDLRQGYNVILGRLRSEARAIPTFATIHELFVERVAFLYILQRQKERPRAPINREDGTIVPERPNIDERKLKELMGLWTNMVDTLNRFTVTASSEAELRDKVVNEVIVALNTTIDQIIPDLDAARHLKQALANTLETADF